MTTNNTQLVKITTGSHLFGLNGPASDLDYEALFLPDLTALMLGKSVSAYKTADRDNAYGSKNEAGQEETNHIPLQKFLADFYHGQTYAIEMAFAIEQGGPNVYFNRGHAGLVKKLMHDLIKYHLCTPTVGLVTYSLKQSKNYRAKAVRLTLLEKVKTLLQHCYVTNHYGLPNAVDITKLDFKWDLLKATLSVDGKEEEEVIFLADGPGARKSMSIAGKVFNNEEKFDQAISRVEKMINEYSQRVKTAAANLGVDPKAASHALRLMFEMEELLVTGKIVFPIQNEDVKNFLLEVKHNRVSQENIDAATESVVDRLKLLVAQKEIQFKNHYRMQLTDEAARAYYDAFCVDILKSFYGIDDSDDIDPELA